MTQTMNYKVTSNPLRATHWLAKEDSKSCVREHIIPGKAYQLIDHDLILGEDGCLSAYWMCHKGDLIIMKENLN